MKIVHVHGLCHETGNPYRIGGSRREFRFVDSNVFLAGYLSGCREQRVSHTTVLAARSHSRKVTLGLLCR